MSHPSNILRIAILGLLALLFSCTQNPGTDANGKAKFASGAALEIPKLLDRAPALRNGKEWDDVQNFYGTQTAALRKTPGDAEAKLKLAECFINEARITGEHPHYYPAALTMLDALLASLAPVENTQDMRQKDLLFRALSHKASVQLSLHDFAAAKITAEKAIAINPYNASIYGCLVDANVELGDYKIAVEKCDKMVSIRPDLRSYSRVSYLRELHGDLPGAIEAMDMAVKAGFPGQEQTEWARLQLGHLHEKKGNLKAAENQYLMSLAAREKYPFAIAALANLEAKKGDRAKAETMLKEAIDIIPEVGFYIDLAKLYRETGREAECQKLVPEIEKMMEEDIAAGHNMSLEAARFHLEVSKNLEKAAVFADDEYARRPNNIAVNQLMADIQTQKGDKTKAAEYLKKAKI